MQKILLLEDDLNLNRGIALLLTPYCLSGV